MMTRRISSGLAIAGLVIASPAIVDITSHFINKPLFLLKDLPETYAVVVMLCGICVIQYSYGFIMHIIYVNISETVILERKFREIFDNPFSRFLVWRETLDVYKERRGW
jgi:hypothetical protein